MNDFDSDKDNDVDNKTYQEEIVEVYKQTKNDLYCHNFFNSCWIQLLFVCTFMPNVLIFIVRLTLKNNIPKLKAGFVNGYQYGDHVFYISIIDYKGNFQFADDEVCAS